jgi:hypothetical protein
MIGPTISHHRIVAKRGDGNGRKEDFRSLTCEVG